MHASSSAWIAQQQGFTLVELLMAMLLSLVVLGAATWGIADAFKQSASVSGRATSSTQAEAGIEALVRDLREAVTCPSGTEDTSTSPATPVSGILMTGSGGSVQKLEFCAPSPGLPEQGATQMPQTALIAWTCNTGANSSGSVAADSCQRSWAALSQSGGTWSSGNWTGSTTIAGVASIVFTGIFGRAASGSSPAAVALSDRTYSLSSGGDCAGSDPCSISWVGIKAQIASLRSDNGKSVANTSPIQIQTGTGLENYDTA